MTNTQTAETQMLILDSSDNSKLKSHWTIRKSFDDVMHSYLRGGWNVAYYTQTFSTGRICRISRTVSGKLVSLLMVEYR